MSRISTKDRTLEPPLVELTRVRTRRPLRQGDEAVPEGAVGTIVHVYERGEAFEVEFAGTSPAVLLAHPADLERE